MTICTLVMTFVTCMIDPSTTVSPAEAARILAPNQFVAYPEHPMEAQSYSTGATNPLPGPWAFPEPAPRLRLDGSNIYDSQWVAPYYLRPSWQRLYGNLYGYGYGSGYGITPREPRLPQQPHRGDGRGRGRVR